MSPSLADGARELGVSLDASQTAQLESYLDAVLAKNREINLTAVRERDDAVVRHLLDSLSLVSVWHAVHGDEPPVRVLDLGTGGGFPGAVLAVVWPSTRVLMIDGTGKKVHAVSGCLARAGIPNAEVFQVRGADLPKVRPSARASFDLCAARAVASADVLVREFAPVVAPGGVVLLMKGPNTGGDEIAAGDREAKRRGLTVETPRTTDVPGLERRLVLVYRRP